MHKNITKINTIHELINSKNKQQMTNSILFHFLYDKRVRDMEWNVDLIYTDSLDWFEVR